MTTSSAVHILGFGAIGALVAAQLQASTKTEIIPLLRSTARLNDFASNDYTIKIKPLYDTSKSLLVARFPAASCPEQFSGKIDNLIVTCKTYQTKAAIEPYLPFLHDDSNIIMIQNGLGVLELLREQVFVGTLQPRLFQGVIAHGIFQDSQDKSLFNHAGFVDCKIAKLPSKRTEISQTLTELQSDKEIPLVSILLQLSESLNLIHMTYQELLVGQLEKFLINCCINSVTSIVDCINGELDSIAKPIFTDIISEALDVFQYAFKPLFQYAQISEGNDELPDLDVANRLSLERMVKVTLQMGCQVNGDNSSSMRQDVVNLRQTEIDYINGYIVSLCEKLQLPSSACKINATIQKLVKLRLELNQRRSEQGDARQR